MSVLTGIYILLLSINLILLMIKWYYKRLVVPLKIYVLIPIGTIALELVSELIFGTSKNNLFLYHIFSPLEYTFYALFFCKIITSSAIRNFIHVSIPVFIVLSIIFGIFVQPITENNSFIILIESVLILSYCLIYLRQILLYEIDRRTEENPFFWIIAGLLFYFIQTFFIEGFLNNLLLISNDKAKAYYEFGFAFKYIMCILVLIGISLNTRSVKT
jgi:hypothetical protein